MFFQTRGSESMLPGKVKVFSLLTFNVEEVLTKIILMLMCFCSPPPPLEIFPADFQSGRRFDQKL